MIAAQRHDLLMPPTVVTNVPTHAMNVLRAGDRRGIYKPIGESGNISANLMTPTSFFTREEIRSDSASIQVAPGCFQRFIPAQFELRTYIFGSRAISVVIQPRAKAHTPDLTCQDLEESDFAATKRFHAYEIRLVRLVRELGLTYAAVDSLVCRGRSYFLEVNPTGGWGWLPLTLQGSLDQEFRRLVLSS
jgi:glutathione synthase/RimK-type ligase-like ATP-grasp enzyme